jgi:chromosome segregation ATPase
MEAGEFESLSKKVEQAVSLIEDLKRERDDLKVELAGKSGEIDALRQELNRKTENMSRAGEHVRDLVSRLEAALA